MSTGRYLYIRWHREATATYDEATAARIGSGPPVATELYDTSRDPFELHNPAGDRAYGATEAALAQELAKLSGCEGQACEVQGRVPSPRR